MTVNRSVKTFPYYTHSNWYLYQRQMPCLLGHLRQIKCQKHRLIRWRNVGSLTFSVCISFVIEHKSRYLKSVNHKIVIWNTNRPRRLYFTFAFSIIPHFFIKLCLPSFVFSRAFICFHVSDFVLNHIYSAQFPAKNCLRNYRISKR